MENVVFVYRLFLGWVLTNERNKREGDEMGLMRPAEGTREE
jgi:hypothetical protein